MFEKIQPQKYYMQIARQVKELIKDGRLKIGDKLPAERTLAEEFGIIKEIRISAGAVAPVPLRLVKTEQAVQDSILTRKQ